VIGVVVVVSLSGAAVARPGSPSSTPGAAVKALPLAGTVNAAESESQVERRAPTPWAGDWIGIVGCNEAKCCCPKAYFFLKDYAPSAPLTLLLFGEMQGKCSGQQWWNANATLDSLDTKVMTAHGPPRNEEYRIEYNKYDATGPGSTGQGAGTDLNHTSRDLRRAAKEMLIFRADGCFFQLERVTADGENPMSS